MEYVFGTIPEKIFDEAFENGYLNLSDFDADMKLFHKELYDAYMRADKNTPEEYNEYFEDSSLNSIEEIVGKMTKLSEEDKQAHIDYQKCYEKWCSARCLEFEVNQRR